MPKRRIIIINFIFTKDLMSFGEYVKVLGWVSIHIASTFVLCNPTLVEY